MSLFGRWFGSGKGPPGGSPAGDLEKQLRSLEEQAKRAPLASRGSLLNRAGDACIKAGDHQRALRYFGEAIDTLLADEQAESARGVARKIIRVHPEAIRTLCTLTWLDLASRQTAAAVHTLGEYVKASKRGGVENMAADQIVEMARSVTDVEFLEAAVKGLEELGRKDDAGQAKEWAQSGGSPEANADPDELSMVCLRAAMGSNARRKSEGAVA